IVELVVAVTLFQRKAGVLPGQPALPVDTTCVQLRAGQQSGADDWQQQAASPMAFGTAPESAAE
ncbi:hypothetical protein Q4595_30915, partial [Wenyingzhuangia sp. 1_MG-2023]|nr:hypothetical protein [Wenyingzhuangia sp. 1_MG-2023]